MIKVENIDVWGFEHAIRGMRNPLNSWGKSDSGDGCCHSTNYVSFVTCKNCNEERDICGCNPYFLVGPNDLDLMKRLYNAGPEHRKYLRQIFVSLDIAAPLYWWKEFDTYKIGTVSNSCSTMHKIHAKEFDIDDFSHEHLDEGNIVWLVGTIDRLNTYRKMYVLSKDKDIWWQLIQMLPSSYNQKRTITMDYENAVTMIRQRLGHKLDEWNEFVDILKGLPYLSAITEKGNDDHA